MDPRTGVSPGLKVMVDRATRWKFAWQQSPLAVSPQEVKDGVRGRHEVWWCAVARPLAPPAEPGQPKSTPRWSGRCRNRECIVQSFGPGQRSFKTDVNFQTPSQTGIHKEQSDLISLNAEAFIATVDLEHFKGPVRLNLWDFGGQDIYHGSHTLFLHGQAIFLLLWNPEEEKTAGNKTDPEHRPITYWLDYLRSAAGTDNPLIIVQSQCDRPEI